MTHAVGKQKGLTLLEILIALLVLSIGMAGLGALMLTALSNVHSSSQFSLASAVALDFEERLWFEIANRSATNPESLNNEGCLTESHIQGVRSALITHWSSTEPMQDWDWTSAERLQATGLVLALDEDDDFDAIPSDSKSGIHWQVIPFSVEWEESRFELEDGMERFAGSIVLVCRPVF